MGFAPSCKGENGAICGVKYEEKRGKNGLKVRCEAGQIGVKKG